MKDVRKFLNLIRDDFGGKYGFDRITKKIVRIRERMSDHKTYRSMTIDEQYKQAVGIYEIIVEIQQEREWLENWKGFEKLIFENFGKKQGYIQRKEGIKSARNMMYTYGEFQEASIEEQFRISVIIENITLKVLTESWEKKN